MGGPAGGHWKNERGTRRRRSSHCRSEGKSPAPRSLRGHPRLTTHRDPTPTSPQPRPLHATRMRPAAPPPVCRRARRARAAARDWPPRLWRSRRHFPPPRAEAGLGGAQAQWRPVGEGAARPGSAQPWCAGGILSGYGPPADPLLPGARALPGSESYPSPHSPPPGHSPPPQPPPAGPRPPLCPRLAFFLIIFFSFFSPPLDSAASELSQAGAPRLGGGSEEGAAAALERRAWAPLPQGGLPAPAGTGGAQDPAVPDPPGLERGRLSPFSR